MAALDKLESLSSCRTTQEWHANLAALAREFGFAQFFFGILKDRTASFDSAFIATNYAQEWRDSYDENRLHAIDPIVSHCAHNIVPLVWQDHTFHGERQSAFYEQACRYGLGSGVSFPMHGLAGEFGIVSFAAAEDGRAFGFANLSALALLRDFAFESSLRFIDGVEGGESPRVRFTPREHDCLQWVMRGKTSWETAKILGCSETTVNFHVSNVNRKLDVKNRQQAVVKALRLRLILADE